MSQAKKPSIERASFIERATIALYYCQKAEKDKRIIQNITNAISQSPSKARMTVDLLVQRGFLAREERTDGRIVYVTTESGEDVKTQQLPLIFKFHGDKWSDLVHSDHMSDILKREHHKLIDRLGGREQKDERRNA
jgi:DNA-binding MarR family transcriptional regulator